MAFLQRSTSMDLFRQVLCNDIAQLHPEDLLEDLFAMPPSSLAQLLPLAHFDAVVIRNCPAKLSTLALQNFASMLRDGGVLIAFPAYLDENAEVPQSLNSCWVERSASEGRGWCCKAGHGRFQASILSHPRASRSRRSFASSRCLPWSCSLHVGHLRAAHASFSFYLTRRGPCSSAISTALSGKCDCCCVLVRRVQLLGGVCDVQCKLQERHHNTKEPQIATLQSLNQVLFYCCRVRKASRSSESNEKCYETLPGWRPCLPYLGVPANSASESTLQGAVACRRGYGLQRGLARFAAFGNPSCWPRSLGLLHRLLGVVVFFSPVHDVPERPQPLARKKRRLAGGHRSVSRACVCFHGGFQAPQTRGGPSGQGAWTVPYTLGEEGYQVSSFAFTYPSLRTFALSHKAGKRGRVSGPGSLRREMGDGEIDGEPRRVAEVKDRKKKERKRNI